MASKGKGSQFERDISRFLSVWLTGTDKPLAFWRSPSSGGLATISELNIDLSGDIIGISAEAKEICSVFSIELKTGYPGTTFWQHFKNIKNFNIKLFWQQCNTDAKRSNKLPMLIYRKKGNKPIIGINDIIDIALYKKIGKLNNIIMKFPSCDLQNICLYDMEEFFKVVTPDDIRGLKNNV